MDSLTPAKLFDVTGMSVVITGGGTGIGFMMAKALAFNGAAKVYIVGRRKEKLEEAAKVSPSNIIPIVGDVTSKDSLRQVAAQVKAETGFVNLLCCNSGIIGKPVGVDTSKVPISEYAEAAMAGDQSHWNDAYATNVTASAFTAYAFLELLDAGNKQRGPTGAQSQILMTSSVASYLRTAGANSSYSCSKVAVNLLVKQLSTALGPYDIRVNAIAPGLFPSEMSGGLVAMGGEPNGDPGVEGAYPRTFIPAKRLGVEEDIAGTVLFLASRAGGYFNGCILLNDGGRLTSLQGTY